MKNKTINVPIFLIILWLIACLLKIYAIEEKHSEQQKQIEQLQNWQNEVEKNGINIGG